MEKILGLSVCTQLLKPLKLTNAFTSLFIQIARYIKILIFDIILMYQIIKMFLCHFEWSWVEVYLTNVAKIYLFAFPANMLSFRTKKLGTYTLIFDNYFLTSTIYLLSMSKPRALKAHLTDITSYIVKIICYTLYSIVCSFFLFAVSLVCYAY